MKEELTTEEKLQKAIWAAGILAKHRHRGHDFWMVERTTIDRTVVGEIKQYKAIALMPQYQSGTEEAILVLGAIGITTKFTWWEAVAIAEALENKKCLSPE